MDLRQQNMIFPKAKLIEEGGCNIDDQIDVMREAVLKKDGIVGAEAQEDFRYFVKNCININVLDQIGGELNSFEKRSFRMRQLSLKKSHTMEEKEINSLEQVSDIRNNLLKNFSEIGQSEGEFKEEKMS